MGLIKSFSGALGGTLADQWKDIITSGEFDERIAIAPGMFIQSNNGRSSNYKGSVAVVSNGSKIYVPENTAAVIFNQSGIEEVVTEAGGYEYRSGQSTIFDGEKTKKSIVEQTKERFGYGGLSPDNKTILFVNLREIRGIKFGTKGPQTYHDKFYDVDLEVLSFGSFSIEITDPQKFIREFVPANTDNYSFDDRDSCSQLLSEFIQSFAMSLNLLSSKYRISKLPSYSNELVSAILKDERNAGNWNDRYGMILVSIAIENIEFSPDSKKLVHDYSANKMNVQAYENVSQRSSNMAAQQKIANGIQDNGLGDGAGMMFGMNMAQNLGNNVEQREKELSFDEQIEMVKKFKDMLDSDILSEEEFQLKKKEMLGL